jgi:hypothetical protein
MWQVEYLEGKTLNTWDVLRGSSQSGTVCKSFAR